MPYQRKTSQRDAGKRSRRAFSASPFSAKPQGRRLGFEALEDRRLLAVLTVQNALDDTLPNLAGDGELSLREAIAIANAPGTTIDGFTSNDVEDTIDFAETLSGETILLAAGELVITESLTIEGLGQELLTIDAGNGTDGLFHTGDGHRIFNISDGTGNISSEVTLSGLTLTGGDGPFSGTNVGGGAINNFENLTVIDSTLRENAAYFGGAISNVGNLTLVGSTIKGNAARRGGGLYAVSGRASDLAIITDSTFLDNTAEWEGGGAWLNATAAISNSTFSGNSAQLSGGGLKADGYGVSIDNSTFLNNSAEEGGGVSLETRATVTDSTFDSNSASGGGGGIYVNDWAVTVASSILLNNDAQVGGAIFNKATFHREQLDLTDCTLSGNTAVGGGGLYNTRNARARIVNSAIIGNVSQFPGGGIDAREGPVELSNSIVAGNLLLPFGETIATPDDLSGTLTGSFNLIGAANSAGGLIDGVDGNIVGIGGVGAIDPLLGPLADNGGPTQTHALLPGSPALNAGDPAFDPSDPDGDAATDDALPFDQRGAGFARVAGGRIDIGAYEAQATPSADFVEDDLINGLDFLAWQRGFGTSEATRADGNSDDDTDVDASDMAAWSVSYGLGAEGDGEGTGGSIELVDAAMAMAWIEADGERTEEAIVPEALLVEALSLESAIDGERPSLRFWRSTEELQDATDAAQAGEGADAAGRDAAFASFGERMSWEEA